MNFKRYHVSKNLWDEQYLNGYYSSSDTFTSADNQICTKNKIPVKPNTVYWLGVNFSQSGFMAILKYDNTGTFIERIITSYYTGQGILYTTDSTTYFIKINFSTTYGAIYNNDIMIAESQAALPYEPYSSEVWHDTPHYIHNTSTDTITTLPADIYANDTTATVGLKGNTMQSGTPTSTTPIMPQGTGERTGNLFDKNRTTGITNNSYINQSGQIASSSNYYISYPILVDVGETYTWSFNSAAYAEHTSPTVGFYDNDDNLISVATHSSGIYHFTFTVPSNTSYIKASVYKVQGYFEPMLLSGNSSIDDKKPMPYIPYGYKIPILSNSTTTPVYLGEVESTRKIKKYVFTGEENGTIYSTATSRKGIEITGITGIIGGNADIAILAICTHYQPNTRTALYRNTDNGISNAYQNDMVIFYDASCQTVEAFQQFCAQQYANGTPVTVWYVLATETTGIVNEPLRKIGDYADEVSGVSIPTIAGANTLSVDTTLQPSEVTVNYKGWHPVSAVHERENGAWT